MSKKIRYGTDRFYFPENFEPNWCTLRPSPPGLCLNWVGGGGVALMLSFGSETASHSIVIFTV